MIWEVTIRILWYARYAAMDSARNKIIVNYVTVFTAGYDVIIVTGYAWFQLEGFMFVTPFIILKNLSRGQAN